MAEVLRKLKEMKRDEIIGKEIPSEMREFYKLLNPSIFE
jgi:hypothetical protein